MGNRLSPAPTRRTSRGHGTVPACGPRVRSRYGRSQGSDQGSPLLCLPLATCRSALQAVPGALGFPAGPAAAVPFIRPPALASDGGRGCPPGSVASRPHPERGSTARCSAALTRPRPHDPQARKGAHSGSAYPVGGEDLPVALLLLSQGRELLHGEHALAATKPSPLWPFPPPFSTSVSDKLRPRSHRTYTLEGREGSAFCLLGRLPLPPPPPNNNKPPLESRRIPTPFAHKALPLGDKLKDSPLANFTLKPSPREGA